MDIFRDFFAPLLNRTNPFYLYGVGAIWKAPRPLELNRLSWYQSGQFTADNNLRSLFSDGLRVITHRLNPNRSKNLVIGDVKCFFGFGQLYRVKGHNLHNQDQP